MVIKSDDDKNISSPNMNAQTSSAAAAANAGYGADSQMHPFMRRGMRGHGWRGMHMGHHGHPHHDHRPEVVSLEGEQARGDSSAYPRHGHGRGAFWGFPPHPDPPLAPMPPVSPETASPPPPPPHPFGFAGVPPAFEGFASLVGEHARNIYGDLAAQFGPSAPGSPGSLPQRDPMGWRGRRGGGPWRGRWGPPGPAHGHHHPPGAPGHFPHHEHGPIRPKMNIQHTGNVFTVTLELPGLQKEEVDISVAEGILTVSGEFVDNTPEATGAFNMPPGYEAEGFEMMDDSGETLYSDGQEIGDGIDAMNLNANQTDCGGFILRERRFGPFKRSIKLPAWVDVDAIKATMAHGVLSLVVEKPEEEEKDAPARKITVL